MKPRSHTFVAWALAVLVLAAVFTAYLDPHVVVDLATRVWACL